MKEKTILHGISALCSALVFAFFALPYYTVTTSLKDGIVLPNVQTGATSTSGYTFIGDALKATTSTSTGTFAAVIALITLIVAGLALVGAIVALLGDFEVIKDEKINNIVSWFAFATVAILAVSCILNLVGNIVLVGNDVKDLIDAGNAMLSTIGGKMTATAGWALTITTLVLGLGALGTNAYAKFKK